MHKADHLREGSTIVLEQWPGSLNPLIIFKSYLTSCDSLFPHLPDLWLNDEGCIPTQSWFIAKMCSILLSNDISGHSLHSGGATALALAGTPLDHIQMIGCWSSQKYHWREGWSTFLQ